MLNKFTSCFIFVYPCLYVKVKSLRNGSYQVCQLTQQQKMRPTKKFEMKSEGFDLDTDFKAPHLC